VQYDFQVLGLILRCKKEIYYGSSTEVRTADVGKRKSPDTEADCTYSIVVDDQGRYLQIDTYGSTNRQIPGKKSQSIRFAPEAIEQLKTLLKEEF